MVEFHPVEVQEGDPPLFLLTLEEVDSTNLEARRRRVQMKGVGLWLVESCHQTSGYGRNGQPWESQSRKNYYGTFAVPYPTQLAPGIWSLWIASHISQAFQSQISEDKKVFVKWPNDVCMLEQREVRKVGGILSEVHDGFLFCGIGLNLEEAPLIRSDFQSGVLTAGALGIPRKVALPLIHQTILRIEKLFFARQVMVDAAARIVQIFQTTRQLPVQWYYYEPMVKQPRRVEIVDIAPDTGALHLKFENGRDAIRLYGSLSAQVLS